MDKFREMNSVEMAELDNRIEKWCAMTKEMIVSHWTINTKYDCPDCGEEKAIKHPIYKCNKCKQEFRLKVKVNPV